MDDIQKKLAVFTEEEVDQTYPTTEKPILVVIDGNEFFMTPQDALTHAILVLTTVEAYERCKHS
jgi:hypothetical protein